MSKDKIPGGLADKKNSKDFDPKALAAGIKVEMEHTSDKSIAKEIAMDHLTEDPKYYEKLKTIEKGFTRKKYRRKIPKVVRWYDRHRNEDKTFDKSEDKMDDMEKGGVGSGKRGHKTNKEHPKSFQDLKLEERVKNAVDGLRLDKLRGLNRILNSKKKDAMKNGNDASAKYYRDMETKVAFAMIERMNKSQENTMAKSIDEQIEEMAKSMEIANTDPKELVLRTIEDLGPEGLKKALPSLSEAQKTILKSVLEETKKSMDFDQVTPEKKMTRLAQSGHEIESASDDEDEKIAAKAEKEVKNQGDASPEGFEGQVIKAKDMDDKKESAAGKKIMGAVDKIAEGEAKEEVKDHEKKMHSKEKMKKMCKSFKDEIIKSYKDAGLEYTDDLVKSQVKAKLEKAMMNKEESQVKPADQVEQGPEDKKADKKDCKDIEVAKDADTKADDVKVMKKSIQWEDPNKLLKACTGGRNMHYSVNAFYDEALAKSKEEPKAEELKKSETLDTNDLIEKGMDTDADSVRVDAMLKSHRTNGHLSESFSSVDLLDAMGLSEEEAKEILGE